MNRKMRRAQQKQNSLDIKIKDGKLNATHTEVTHFGDGVMHIGGLAIPVKDIKGEYRVKPKPEAN